MRVICPACGTAYRVPDDAFAEEGTVFVCARCGHAFDRTGEAAEAPSDADGEEAAREPAAAAASGTPAPVAPPEDALPVHPRARLAPWLALVLLIAAALGAYVHRAEWLARPEVRGLLMRFGVALPARAGDWAIVPGSVHLHRLTRRDGGEVFALEGAVRNRLWHAQPPPRLRLRFLDGSGAPLAAWIAPITEPPRLEAILAGPVAPPVDTTPVPAAGVRSFLLVLDGVPAGTRTVEAVPVPH